VSGSVSVFGARVPPGVGGSRERERARPAVRAFRVPHTNSLSPTLTLAATRDPRAGPSGGPEFPDKL
jgi:hypothetical protein